jgi:hypothetical protein
MGELITAKELTSGVKGMSEKTVIGKFEEFLKSVESDGYKIVPTISAFADFIEKPRGDVHEWFRLHPTASKQMRDMCADTIASGAMLKKYVPNVTNFALKNWCGWEEAPTKKGKTSRDVADEKKAKEALDAYMAAERRKSFKVV